LLVIRNRPSYNNYTIYPEDIFMDVVKTDAGYLSGTVLGESDNQIYVFRGIPYASPPTGDLWWKPPQPVAPWSGIRECTVYSRIAPQSPFMAPPIEMPQSEDCLYLNLWSPAKNTSDRLPVMVWMHGGGLISESGNEYNGLGLSSKGVVLITVNMRLGPLGCLAHPLLSRESPQGVSGNYLFLDMLAALNWVQRNISFFGGNPDNVTIFGESGGSTKVVNLMASPLAKGLFHRAIGESECGFGTPLKVIEARGEILFAKLGIDKEKDSLAAARALPWKKIIEAGKNLTVELNLPWAPPWGPWDSAVDGWFLRDTPANIFKEGKQNAVPFIMGANQGELTGPSPIEMPWLPSNYVKLFTGANKVGGKAYAYIFDQVPAGWKRDGVVSVHFMEIPYVFGELDNRNLWGIPFGLAKPSGARSPDPGLTNRDREVSQVMMSIWTQFAKTGNPSLKGIIDWPAWEQDTDQYLYITESLQVKSGFSRVAQK
jgi:para-nitrobenzyl esterase